MEDIINRVSDLLNRVRDYNRIIQADNFEAATVEDIKGNAKALCDEVKSDIDAIKSLINQWE